MSTRTVEMNVGALAAGTAEQPEGHAPGDDRLSN